MGQYSLIKQPPQLCTYNACTDGSKNEAGVGSGIAVFSGSSLKTTLKYRLNERCTNNQAEQMAILKALE
jgi:ribonuclease HI